MQISIKLVLLVELPVNNSQCVQILECTNDLSSVESRAGLIEWAYFANVSK